MDERLGRKWGANGAIKRIQLTTDARRRPRTYYKSIIGPFPPVKTPKPPVEHP